MLRRHKKRAIAIFVMLWVAGAMLVGSVLSGRAETGILKIKGQGIETTPQAYLPLVNPKNTYEHLMVQRFAPVLNFDGSYNPFGLPMSAQVYFDNMMNMPGWSPYTAGNYISWRAEDDPVMAPGRAYNCGRDDCRWGMSNNDFSTLTNGTVPTYYKVIYEASGRARIAYWWFYGWQDSCNDVECLFAKDGAHHGDWEHIMVTTTANREAVEYVTYFFHGDWYTRQWPNFTLVGERPAVYVGKLAHGSYHSRDCSGWMAGTPSQCCEYADYRNPNPTTVWNTSLNLVNLDSNSEAWMVADHSYRIYYYNGTMYTIYPWTWGPWHAWCAECFFGCVDWEHTYACATHPTTDSMDWTLHSCGGVGCGDYKAGCPYDCTYHHNNPWPWGG